MESHYQEDYYVDDMYGDGPEETRVGFNVTYYLGKRSHRQFVMYVTAKDEEDAKYLAGLRIPYQHGSPIKFTIVNVERSTEAE